MQPAPASPTAPIPAPAAAPVAAIAARGLTKRYGEFVAVAGIDFSVQPGECFGFLGPNGAGKTTTMKMIYGAVAITDGALALLGTDVRTDLRTAKRKLGVVPQDDNLDAELSALENLQVFGRFHGLARPDADRRARELLEFFELADKSGARVETLSGGMRRRLLLARGLIGNPQVLLLDEPTVGLDPAVRNLLWVKLRALRARGVTLLLSTHYMEEAERLCDRLVIVDHGRIIAQGTPRELIAKHVGAEVLELRHIGGVDAPPPSLDRYAEHILRHEIVGDEQLVFTPDADGLLHRMKTDGVVFESAFVRRGTLEDVFLRLTGRRLE